MLGDEPILIEANNLVMEEPRAGETRQRPEVDVHIIKAVVAGDKTR